MLFSDTFSNSPREYPSEKPANPAVESEMPRPSWEDDYMREKMKTQTMSFIEKQRVLFYVFCNRRALLAKLRPIDASSSSTQDGGD